MSRSTAIDALLLEAPQLWRGREPNRSQRTLSTGHVRLDTRLPGGGWPLGAITEILSEAPGLGELSLLLPALAEFGRRGQWLVLVDPPWIPYPGALHGHGLALERLLVVHSGGATESLWACEQALHGTQGGAVLAWPERLNFARLKRLQLAAEAGGKAAFLFRPGKARLEASPAALRLQLHCGERDTIRIEILKCRGERPRRPVSLPRHLGSVRIPALPLPASKPSSLMLPAGPAQHLSLPANASLN